MTQKKENNYLIWYKRKVAELLMDKRDIERIEEKINRLVDESMKPENIKIEYGPFKEDIK